MKKSLNKTFVRTTNNFQLNDFKIDIDFPAQDNIHDYIISGTNSYKVSLNENFSSEIGLSHKNYKLLDINLDDSEDTINIEYDFLGNDSLVDYIKLESNKDCKKNIIITYKSLDDNAHYHDGKILVSGLNKSNLNITLLNLMSKKSTYFQEFETKSYKESNININIMDVGANIRVYRVNTITNDDSSSSINMAYIGKDENKIDINFNYVNNGINSNNDIEVEGLLKDKALKHFKGIIDFKKGAKNSVGKENENVIILDDGVISRSLPIMLCEEEDVDGSHSTSSGVLDKDKIYYLMAHGIDEKEARNMLITSSFNKVTRLMPDAIKENIDNIIISNL